MVGQDSPVNISSDSDSSDTSEMTCMLDFMSAKGSSPRDPNHDRIEDDTMPVHEYTRLTYRVERVSVAALGVEVVKTLLVT